LKRKTPITARRSAPRRGAPARRRKGQPARAHERGGRSDRAYLAQVRKLLCCAPFEGHVSCDGPVEAHHAGRRGVGQKCHDHETVPLCRLAHRQFHNGSGPFKGLTKAERRAWAEDRIARTQRQLGLVKEAA